MAGVSGNRSWNIYLVHFSSAIRQQVGEPPVYSDDRAYFRALREFARPRALRYASPEARSVSEACKQASTMSTSDSPPLSLINLRASNLWSLGAIILELIHFRKSHAGRRKKLFDILIGPSFDEKAFRKLLYSNPIPNTLNSAESKPIVDTMFNLLVVDPSHRSLASQPL